MKGICVLSSWLFNQPVPDSKFFKGSLIRKKEYYCLHVWIEYENEIYDIEICIILELCPCFTL